MTDDPELGPVKQCSRCGESWPADADFFYMQRRRRADGTQFYKPSSMCIACWLERKSERRAERAVA